MEETLFKNIVNIIVTHPWRMLSALLFTLGANCLLFANPLLLRKAIAEGNQNPIKYFCIFVTIGFISAILRYYMRVEFNKISRVVERDTRAKIFKRIQGQSMSFYDRHGIGELIERLSNDMNAYRDVLGPGLIFPTNFVATIIPGLGALFYISPTMALLTLIPLVIIPILNIISRKYLFIAAHDVQTKLAEMASYVQEDYSGIREVKSYVAENSLNQRFTCICREFFGLNFKLMCYQGWFFPLFVGFTRLVTILLVLVAGLITLSPGDFISFMWVQSYVFFPIIILGWVVPIWQQGRSAYSRLKHLYEEPNEVSESLHLEEKIPPKASIEFKNLSFTYPGQEKPVLDNISLHLSGGSLTAISGPPGSGKTTLFKLINREYEIPNGMIYIGEQEIHSYPVTAFWQEIVAVDQMPFLFSKTVGENVGFGNVLATEQDIWHASEMADLHDSVMSFEKGYETLVGEKGVTLSGGQKTRLAMARAFLVNRSILLLDDIFASLDNNTALRIFDSLKKNMKGRTIIINTSKANLLEQMDLIVFIVDGKVVEKGSPADLQKIQGHYTALKELEALIEPKSP